MVKETISIKSWDKAAIWPGIVEATARAARLSAGEKVRLSESLTAEIITATAYISGCIDPDRIAVAHLTTLIAATRCPEIYGHRNGESLSDRLLTGAYFPGGNPEAVKACLLLLEMISLNDHRADFKNDLISGKDNPLISDLNYDQEKERIEKEYSMFNSIVKQAFSEYYKNVFFLSGWF